jgi:PDZ domain
MQSLQVLRRSMIVLFLLPSAPFMYGKSTQTVNASCEDAMAQATVLAAHRKRASLRPYPTAPALNVESNRNFAKVYFFGSVWSHKKYGELAFDATGDASCSVTSNGHPADVLLSDLLKAYGHSTVEGLSTTPNATNSSREASDAGTRKWVELSEQVSRTPNAAMPIPALGLMVATRDKGGVQIVAVTSGSVSELAYLHVGDVINAVDGKSVTTAMELAAVFGATTRGTKVRIGYLFHTAALGDWQQEAVIIAQ